jgi:hypothetical protein
MISSTVNQEEKEILEYVRAKSCNCNDATLLFIAPPKKKSPTFYAHQCTLYPSKGIWKMDIQ